jgi:GDP-D-mannose dehydratase
LVMVNDQTRYRQGQQDIQMEDLKPDDHVFARGKTNDNKEFVANTVRRVTDEEMQRFQAGGDRTGGQIVSIDGNQLKVQNPRQGEKVVTVNEQTTFMKDGQPITLKDLKVGDRIFAVGKETDGKFVATRVMSGPFQRGGMGRRSPAPNQEKQ